MKVSSLMLLSGKKDQTSWFLKAELLMLTRFMKIMLLVNIHVRCEKTRKVNYDVAERERASARERD